MAETTTYSSQLLSNTVFDAVDITVLVIYFLAVVATGLFAMFSSKRDTTAGYFLAGRFITFIPIGASLFASNIGSQHFIGLAGSGAAAGIGVGAFEVNALLLLQLLGWVFLPVYLASGVFTLPEYIRKRFGGRRIQVYLSVLSLALYILTKISVNLYSGSLFIKIALHWDFVASVVLIIALTAFCTISGGLAAVIYTDTIQAFLMVVGGLILMIFGFVEVGGINELYRKYMEAIPSDKPENSTCGLPRDDALVMMRDPVGSDMPWPGFVFGQTTASIWFWCADQVIVQRALAAKNLSHAQGASLFAGYLKILPLFMMVMPGMISRVLFTDEIACATPEVCDSLCNNPAGCTNFAYPMMIMNLMPTGLRGLMVAVMLAALITDLTSIFNSSSSLFTMDIYPLFRRNPSNRELMIVGRLFVVVMTVISILWVPVIQGTQGGQLYIYIQSIAAYLTPPIAAVFMTAIIWSRANEKGAFWSLMAGLVTGTIRMVLDFIYPEPYCYEEDTRPSIIADVHYMYFAVLIFGQTVIVMVVISLLTEPPVKWMCIRTVFWNRFDETVRPDEYMEYQDYDDISFSGIPPPPIEHYQAVELIESSSEKQEVELDTPSSSSSKSSSCSSVSVGCCDRLGAPSTYDEEGKKKTCDTIALDWLKFLAGWFCGLSFDESEFEDPPPKSKAECEKEAVDHVHHLIEILRQPLKTRILLNVNLVIIIGVALFMLIFFSIPPEVTGLLKVTGVEITSTWSPK